jgi:hypothetical protein
VLLLQAVAERQRWKAEYAAAQLAATGPPPDTNRSATKEAARATYRVLIRCGRSTRRRCISTCQ